jgi:hypothetical protein
VSTMRVSRVLCLMLMVPGFLWAQTGAPPAGSSTNTSDVGTQLDALREALVRTEQQVAAQQREIEELKEQAKAGQVASVGNEQSPRVIDAAMHTPIPSSVGPVNSSSPGNVDGQPVAQEQGKENQAPLGSFNIGDAVFTPGGFVDLENIFRTTNTQNNIATNFAAIPYGNTVSPGSIPVSTCSSETR